MFSLHVVLGIAILGKPGLHIFFINLSFIQEMLHIKQQRLFYIKE